MVAKSKRDEVEPLTESLTFTVDLPAEVRTVPEHETAVAIPELPGDPGDIVPSNGPSTTTITVASESVAVSPPEEEPAPIPELPESDVVYTRRGKKSRKVSSTPESAAMLTADRLIEPRRRRKPAPEGFLQRLLYDATFHLVNVGDSYRVRERKALDARIGKHFDGGTRFVAVLSRKGGVGKTTITTILGMAMAKVREDRVIAIDANPDRGTLAERVTRQNTATVRDVVAHAKDIGTFSQFQELITRDSTRLHILASDTDPLVSEAFDEAGYNVVADMAERFYSVAITDCGTGVVHSVMKATLERADSVVIVSGGSVDEARLASETLTWLESNGYGHLVENAIVALNTSTQGTNLVKLEEIEAHFQSRVRDIARIPYDAHLATGALIDFDEIAPLTKSAARDLAALVIDGIPELPAD